MKISNIIKILLSCFFPIVVTSCFEILEEIDVNKDGSGKMSVTMNLSQSKNKVSTVMLMDSINGYKIPKKSDIQKQLNDLTKKLTKTEGISNVSSSVDFNNYIITVSFNFSGLSAVNNAAKNIFSAYKLKSENAPIYSFDKQKRIFKSTYKTTDSRAAYNKLKKEDKEVFKTASYTSIYRFQFPVEKCSNINAKISKSKKAVMQQTSILNIINNKINISNQIQL